MHGKDDKSIQKFSQRNEQKRPYGKIRHTWKDNIKIGMMMCTGLFWLKKGPMATLSNDDKPSSSITARHFLASFSRILLHVVNLITHF
jgi:hypothetical protein